MTTYIALASYKALIHNDNPRERQVKPELDIGNGDNAGDDSDCNLNNKEAEDNGDEDEDETEGDKDKDKDKEDRAEGNSNNNADEADGTSIPTVLFKQSRPDSADKDLSSSTASKDPTRQPKHCKVLNRHYAGPKWKSH